MEDERRGSRASRMSKDEGRLAEMGYKQELDREWSMIHNFGVSFSIISVITGITTLFQYGLNTGGPGVMSVGWICVCFFTMFVALGMAEIVSAIPNAGGPYFWSAILAKKKYAPFASWVTGWFNLLGQVAVTTGITFGCAGLISTLASVQGFEPTAGKTLGEFLCLQVNVANCRRHLCRSTCVSCASQYIRCSIPYVFEQLIDCVAFTRCFLFGSRSSG